ncbi:putative leucine-rich repeat-containing protein DDB_G0290503 isoform X1 [Drosophila subobscura]|uniref:putative leucine-rich repeat-containing protein DDB_G0290503 isoform X1 n=1 Tax=Drosophila subobscura TaxID=7241 RepID=UPI00155B37F6|nr:putative leucine-rich repeat-containing protein DDB_G0290503 isoform X1 [Drosophila subobscura]
MSFSKAKLKRFNDVDVALCASPAASNSSAGSTGSATPTTAAAAAAAAATVAANPAPVQPERKEQIEKFFKDAVRFASSSKEAKEFAIPKEDKKSKGLRLFRTPSLPQRLRFRPAPTPTEASTSGASTAASTPLHSATTTPVKEAKSANRLKGKEALQQEIRHKNELIESQLSQLDVLRRHVEQLKEAEVKLREEHEQAVAKTEQLIEALTSENHSYKERNEQLSVEHSQLMDRLSAMELTLHQQREEHERHVDTLIAESEALRLANEQLQLSSEQQMAEQNQLNVQLSALQADVALAKERCSEEQQKTALNIELIENLQKNNASLLADVTLLKEQIEQDALSYAQEAKSSHAEQECLRVERNTLKNDLANKCTLIRSLQDELLDKNCEIDAHCDTIRQLCREQARQTEQQQAVAKVQQQVENDMENAVEREKSYWRAELDKRQKLAENELIKIELEKQDVMVLLETTNDMLRQRDEKLQKCEEQLRNGIDYYIQLSDALQQQLVQLKQDMAKTITEKYNYQLTLTNTRSTVNILMERLKKSDADVEQFKAELESVQLAKGALEQSYLGLQADAEQLRQQLTESQEALNALRSSSQTLQSEVSLKESMLHELLAGEAETLAKFNKIANSFQERIDGDAQMAHYYELQRKDETREAYMVDMKKALDEFATVLQFAQLELDNKEQMLVKVREECEQLKLENIALKSKQPASVSMHTTPSKANKPNTTDLEKIEDLLIDSELRAECDKITSWLLNSSEKCVRQDSSNEISELLSCKSSPRPQRTPKVATPHSPRTPRTPRTPRSAAGTPKKTVLFPGKENVPSPPQKQVLKARNV